MGPQKLECSRVCRCVCDSLSDMHLCACMCVCVCARGVGGGSIVCVCVCVRARAYLTGTVLIYIVVRCPHDWHLPPPLPGHERMHDCLKYFSMQRLSLSLSLSRARALSCTQARAHKHTL